MGRELGSRFKQVGIISEKIRDLVRGRTLRDEASVRRIILYPNTISFSDIGRYKKSKLDSAALLAVSPLMGDNAPTSALRAGQAAVQKELERQRNLTPEQIIAEVILDAKDKAKKWKL